MWTLTWLCHRGRRLGTAEDSAIGTETPSERAPSNEWTGLAAVLSIVEHVLDEFERLRAAHAARAASWSPCSDDPDMACLRFLKMSSTPGRGASQSPELSIPPFNLRGCSGAVSSDQIHTLGEAAWHSSCARQVSSLRREKILNEGLADCVNLSAPEFATQVDVERSSVQKKNCLCSRATLRVLT